MLHAARTNSYYGMEYMLYGKNTAGSARGGAIMKTVSGKTGNPGRAGRRNRKADGLPDRAGVFLASVQPCGHGRTFPQEAENKRNTARRERCSRPPDVLSPARIPRLNQAPAAERNPVIPGRFPLFPGNMRRPHASAKKPTRLRSSLPCARRNTSVRSPSPG